MTEEKKTINTKNTKQCRFLQLLLTERKQQDSALPSLASQPCLSPTIPFLPMDICARAKSRFYHRFGSKSKYKGRAMPCPHLRTAKHWDRCRPPGPRRRGLGGGKRAFSSSQQAQRLMEGTGVGGGCFWARQSTACVLLRAD